MTNFDNDNYYNEIVDDILKNKEFCDLKDIDHHGVTRYNHSLKVSYYSYKIAKILNLDYEKTARAGLLHDFFFSNSSKMDKERITSVFNHPQKAALKSREIFNISELEEDIIKTHMFPINLSIPKYAESWIVNLVDKTVSIKEFFKKFGYKFAYASNLYILFLLNYMK